MSNDEEAALTLSREDLYELVWSKPMRELAKDFGISDVGLAKRCRRLKIPVPGRGYWGRIDAGQKPYQPKLPERKPQVLDYSALTAAPSTVADDAAGAAAPADDTFQEKADAAWLAQRTAFEERAESLVEVPATTGAWHPVVRSIRDDLEHAAKEMRVSRKASDGYDKWPAWRKGREMCKEAWKWRHGVDRGQRLQERHKGIAFRVSLDTYERAVRIVNALALAAAQRDFAVSENKELGRVVFASHGVEVQLRVAEDLDTKTRVRVGYSGAKEQEKYKVPTGRLRITVQSDWREGTYIADHGATTLEGKLNRLFAMMYRLIVKHRAHQRTLDACHRQREADERRREDAKRLREEQERLAAEERRRRRTLLVEAKRWRNAALLRDYVAHIRASRLTSATGTWADWALQVADDLDPAAGRVAGASSRTASDPVEPESPGSIVLGR